MECMTNELDVLEQRASSPMKISSKYHYKDLKDYSPLKQDFIVHIDYEK